jgi:hypothetical protein
MFRKIALIIVGIGVPAAVGAGELKHPEESLAVFRFIKGYEKAELFGGTMQVFGLQPVLGSCKKIKVITGLNWMDGHEKSKGVPAGSPVNLFAQTQVNSNGRPGYINKNYCAASVTFTPKAGGRYSVTQRVIRPISCNVEVIDETTGAPPPDLVVNPAAACR